MIKKLTAAMLALLFVISAAGCKEAISEQGYFENTEWGMTKTEVNDSTKREIRNAQNGTLICNDVGEVEFFSASVGKATSITYYFSEKGGLVQVILTAEVTEKSSESELFEAINSTLSAVFEKDENRSSKTNAVWKTPTGFATVTAFNSKILLTYEKK